MTNLEALKASIGFPITDAQAELILLNRSVDKAEAYTGTTTKMQLSKADALILASSSPNIGEGGYSISQSDKSVLISEANRIYEANGESSAAPVIRNASNIW
jgi:hypothetical protein